MAGRQAAARAVSRRLLAGLAGGIRVWVGVYGLISWRETHWADRDTVLLPSLENGRVPMFTALEGRIVARYRDHVEHIMAEEKSP